METTHIVELRQYTLRPGARDTLTELFEREFVTGQEAAGIRVGGRFADLDDPDRFVWMRGFPGMPARLRSLRAFYGGPVWRAHRDAANATMTDSDDVLLLRGPGYRVPPHAGQIVVTVCHPADPAVFAEALARPGGLPADAAVHRSEHAPNDFPALPVRTGEDVVLWFTAFADAGERPGRPELPAAVARLPLLRPPRRLRLAPVRVPGTGGPGTQRRMSPRS
ncbi:NIPSNAP family protein [Actinacidiphila glaucinigra]|uniref:NIPSNAP family protein n=1 Tax=Actinacidiphila glaucinigra TaxID=235986 RepID=UPI00368F5B00